ncbi:MAG: glycyl-radical enzyme activating protein [Oscillospiraceae bacterium]|nr:glycyl-radical enzyme activating protein [Oscillospiraceae bacterium]
MSNIKFFQKGFNFSQDGPGNRLVIHLQGCNMKCPWCSNPEGMAFGGTLIKKGKLKQEACPFGAISDDCVNRTICEDCSDKLCISKFGGLKLSCSELSVDDLLQECLRCEPMFFDGGGVTLTGGEPTMQFEAVRELLVRLKENGIHTALETNATNPRLPELFEFVDFLITDIKHYDNDTHKLVTGIENTVVINNIRNAAQKRKQLLIRIPLIGGFNCRKDDEKGFGDILSEICTEACSVELLRYHEYGKDKWLSCGMDYKMKDAHVSDEVFVGFKDELVARGLHIVKT